MHIRLAFVVFMKYQTDLNLPMAKAMGFLCTIELLPYLRMDTDSNSTRLSWANTSLVLIALCARFKTLDFSSL